MVQPPSDRELERLAAEASHHRNRFRLQRARVTSGSGRGPAPAELRQLERIADAAEDRLAQARRTRAATDDGA